MFGTEKMKFVAPQFRAMAQAAQMAFDKSPVQQQAFHQLITDTITAPCQRIKCDTIDIPLFLTAVLNSLIIYGYALFRYKHGSDFLPEVADPHQYYIRRIPQGWKPCCYDDGSPMKSTRGWHLVVLEEPSISLTGGGGMERIWMTTIPRSCSQRSINQSLSLDEMTLHRRQRNLFNSQPTMFMSEPPEAKQSDTQASWQSLYAQPSGAPTRSSWALEPVGQQSLQQMIGSRLRASKLLREHDGAVTLDQVWSGNGVGSVPIIPGGLEPTRGPGKQPHAELILSTGMSATPSRHLEGDAFESLATRDLIFSIYDAFHVPPGKFGLNRNTERMAGNLLISQQPMYIYSRWVERIIAALNGVLVVVKCPEIKSVPDPAFVQMISGVLTPDAAARIYSETYNLNESDIDKERLALDTDQDAHVKKSPAEHAAEKLMPSTH